MNGRVLLLVIVTGLFMMVWDGDQAAMQAALAKRSERQQSTQVASITEPPRACRRTAASAPLVLTGVTSVLESATPVSSSGTEHGNDSQVPLPPGIAAGEYQAINQTGRVMAVTVPRSQDSRRTGRDFYVADGEDGQRWYLIRIVK